MVTGGAGFVGVNLIKRLLDEGADIRATLHINKPVLNDNRIEYFYGDLRIEENCQKAVAGVDYVFMCAANTSGAKVMATTPLVHLTPNILMNMQMLQAAYTARVKKFLFISTNTVYPLTDFPVKESDVTNNFYESYHIVAWMKRFTEIVCEMYSNRIKEPMKTIVVRPGNLYGPYDKFDWEKSKVIPAIMRRAIERHDPFEVWGDGMDLKDFLYIDDCIEATLKLFDSDFHGPINIGSEEKVSINEMIDKIEKIADKKVKRNYQLDKPKGVRGRNSDNTLIRHQLNWEPKFSLYQGLEKTYKWIFTEIKKKHNQ
mgnify:CR=1 FL=1